MTKVFTSKQMRKNSWNMSSDNQQTSLNSEVSCTSLNAVPFSVSEILIYVIRVIVRSTQINISLTNRVKSGNFGHQVNSDIHLQTVEIQMRQLLISGGTKVGKMLTLASKRYTA